MKTSIEAINTEIQGEKCQPFANNVFQEHFTDTIKILVYVIIV